jgi:hypothetical protein
MKGDVMATLLMGNDLSILRDGKLYVELEEKC